MSSFYFTISNICLCALILNYDFSVSFIICNTHTGWGVESQLKTMETQWDSTLYLFTMWLMAGRQR